jgi:hypothetical protein
LAEGGGLENRFSRKETGVRIPLPPPSFLLSKKLGEISPSDEGGEADPLFYLKKKLWRNFTLRRCRRVDQSCLLRLVFSLLIPFFPFNVVIDITIGYNTTTERWPSMAEGARLLSEYPGKLGSRVQIPLSPPFFCLQNNEEN